jgi:hypothetical protein
VADDERPDDIGTLWAAFQAFGHAPPPAELVR